MLIETVDIGTRRYKLFDTEDSSAKYGPCEACGKPASHMFHQVEMRKFEHGYTYEGCSDVFGHRGCCAARRVTG